MSSKLDSNKDCVPPPEKVAKISNGDESNHVKHTLDKLKVHSVLRNFSKEKNIAIHAEFMNKNDTTSDALILLEKMPFTSDVVQLNEAFDECGAQDVTVVMENDIYHKYNLHGSLKLFNQMKMTVVEPATQKHLDKYKAQPVHLVRETGKHFAEITWPHLQSNLFTLDWVYNILDGKAEQDRVLYSDHDPLSGFLLSLDYKWDGKQMEDLYCLAIVRNPDIHCLRNLNREHIPLLEKIQSQCRKVIQHKYSLRPSQLRLYIHYLPTFYRLHVHVTHFESQPPGIATEKAHLLEQIIDNLRTDSDYYKNATLYYTVQENNPLYTEMIKAACIVTE